MDDKERVAAELVLLVIVIIGSLAFMHMSSNERMAKDGFIPFRLSGDSRIYWVQPQKEEPSREKLIPWKS